MWCLLLACSVLTSAKNVEKDEKFVLTGCEKSALGSAIFTGNLRERRREKRERNEENPTPTTSTNSTKSTSCTSGTCSRCARNDGLDSGFDATEPAMRDEGIREYPHAAFCRPGSRLLFRSTGQARRGVPRTAAPAPPACARSVAAASLPARRSGLLGHRR